MVLANPRLDIYEDGRQDIAAGLIDARILTILQLASEHHILRVSSLKTGHSRCVGGGNHDGCRVSHHWYGRGADISIVGGQPVTADNARARRLALLFARLRPELRPDELGIPWPDLEFSGAFSDKAHTGHLHLGFGLNP